VLQVEILNRAKQNDDERFPFIAGDDMLVNRVFAERTQRVAENKTERRRRNPWIPLLSTKRSSRARVISRNQHDRIPFIPEMKVCKI
jgi:hypothetical protein